MKIKYIILMIIPLLLTGCFLDPYTNHKYGEMVIASWYSYKDGDNDLGKTRRNVENIGTIEGQHCKFVEKYNKNYIFYCSITYKEKGETIIPFSESKELNVYASFTPNKDEFTYNVYNSNSEKNVWKNDEKLK